MSKKGKFVVDDITDLVVIAGYGNLKGNIGLLEYTDKEIEEMIKENNNEEDNIRLILSLLDSIRELRGEPNGRNNANLWKLW